MIRGMQCDFHASSKTWGLPPLILHPVSEPSALDRVALSLRANLALQGVMSDESSHAEEWRDILLEGRYYEVRTLYYVGKDSVRWIEQCTDFIRREPELADAGILWQSFAKLLVEDPPIAVRRKLGQWGLTDHKALFARAIGLNIVFSDVPNRQSLTNEFIFRYHEFTARVFDCKQLQVPFVPLPPANFHFDIFKSDEYARVLERQWQTQDQVYKSDK
jgi:hypothetical protein